MRLRSTYKRLLPYFRRHRATLVLGVACLVGGRLALVGAPRLLRVAINDLRALAEGAAGGPSARAEAILYGWLFLGASVVAGLLAFGMRRAIVGTSRHVERALKADVFRHVQRLPASFFDRTRSGDLLSRLTSDVEAVRFSLGPGLMYVSSTLVLAPLALASMIELHAQLALVVLAPLVGIGIVVRVMAPRVMRRSRAVQDRLGDLSARAQESFSGARVVRAYATEDVERAAFRSANAALMAETLGLAGHRAWMTGLLYLLGGLGNLAVIWLGGREVIAGRLDFGDLVAFLAYVSLLIWPMISVGWVVSSFQRSAAAMARLDQILDTPVEADMLLPPADLPTAWRGAIEAKNLAFTHEGRTERALDGVSFSLPAGGTLGLVGPVAGGKSTLIDLLVRRRNPPAGTLFLDGRDVLSIPLGALRSAFAVVPQDAFLFSDTLARNLEVATPAGLDPARAQEALDLAGLASEVATFPQGLETEVGERGLTLSGGQKQRMTIARALLREAPILVLDDATSAVDTETEAAIQGHLRTVMRRRTTIVVAHRLGTVRHADRILVLSGGRVVESGTHDELLVQAGWYARTYERQRLEARLENPR